MYLPVPEIEPKSTVFLGDCVTYSKMVRCAVTLDTSFVQCLNREHRMVDKTTLLNSACIVPWRTNVNKKSW